MKPYRKTQQQRPRKSKMKVGVKAVLEALQEGLVLEKIFVLEEARNPDIFTIQGLAKRETVPLQRVPEGKFRYHNIETAEQCFALVSRIKYQLLDDLLSMVMESGETALILALDGITDVRNIGAIARTAYAMGVHGIVVPDKGTAPLGDDAMETSAGALVHLTVCRVPGLMKAVDIMHSYGLKVYAAVMEGKEISEAELAIPCAIILGSEDKGIHPGLENICDERVGIPMPGKFESLNVSVANGIILYEAIRQRKKPNG